MDLHPESLLQLSLVRQMLDDERVAQVSRAIDARWSYEQVLPISVTGFNPYAGAVFHARRSAYARWLADPGVSARDLNENDVLVNEVCFAVHDYLHVWSTRLLADLVPELGFGVGRVDERRLEELAFLHLVTEAVATVGLDYWYLCKLDLNAVVPIGTLQGPLSTVYREADLPEYRQANPDFTVQTPDFFVELARFYATGQWHGFDLSDLRRSPKIFRWIRRELSYGSTQRRNVRMWLRYLATGVVAREESRDSAPIAIDEPWQERLLVEVGRLLWDKIHHGHEVSFAPPRDAPWTTPARGLVDYRFTNLNALGTPALDVRDLAGGEENASYLAFQQLSRCTWDSCDPELRALIVAMLQSKQVGGLPRLLRGLEPLVVDPDEPLDLMFFN